MRRQARSDEVADYSISRGHEVHFSTATAITGPSSDTCSYCGYFDRNSSRPRSHSGPSDHTVPHRRRAPTTAATSRRHSGPRGSTPAGWPRCWPAAATAPRTSVCRPPPCRPRHRPPRTRSARRAGARPASRSPVARRARRRNARSHLGRGLFDVRGGLAADEVVDQVDDLHRAFDLREVPDPGSTSSRTSGRVS